MKRIILRVDVNKSKYYIDNKEVDVDEWLKTKSIWDVARSYNHIENKKEFTDCTCYAEGNFYIWVFTTTK